MAGGIAIGQQFVQIETRTWVQQDFLHGEAGRRLEAIPLIDRDYDSGLHATAGDDLRPFLFRFVDEFAESRLRVLELPSGHGYLYQLVIALVRRRRNGGFLIVRGLEAMPHFRGAAEVLRNLSAHGLGEGMALGENIVKRAAGDAQRLGGGSYR